MKNKKIAVLLLVVLITPLLSGCTKPKTPLPARKGVVLNYWRVFDGPDTMQEIIKNYNAQHSYVTINYKKLRFDEYEQALLEGFATDKGPDIFSIHNTWIRKYQEKELIQPMPPTVKVVYYITKGTIKKDVIPELREKKTISIRQIQNDFVDAVAKDVVITYGKRKQAKQGIFGLPFSMDTMAMYFNRDLFNNAGVTNPSSYWNRKFQQDVKKLTKQDAKGNIIQSGVALGGSINIERYSDILALLMMQNGTNMMDDSRRVTYQQTPSEFKSMNYNPGLEAVRFYTDFANPAKEVYSWNKELDNSIDAFIAGKLAMMFGYSYHLPVIKSKNPKLNFSIASMPQIEGNDPVNFANYWVESVSNKTKHPDEAWDFLIYATGAKAVKSYLTKTKKPTALRALINDQSEDLDIGIFVDQVLTAKSWYQGNNPGLAEEYIAEMIDKVVAGQGTIENNLNTSALKVQQTVTY